MGAAQYPPGLPATGGNGAVVKDTSGTAEIDGNVADGASSLGVILNNAQTLANGGARLVSVQNNGVAKLTITTVGGITSVGGTWAANGTNATATVTGNHTAADTGSDVVAKSTVTRTAGNILQIVNNAATVNSFDFNGKMVPASIPTVKAAGAAFCGSAALDSSGTVTIATTAVTATSLILCWMITAGGTVGGLYRAATADISAGTSFIIRSFVASTAGAVTAATTDTSTVGWLLIG